MPLLHANFRLVLLYDLEAKHGLKIRTLRSTRTKSIEFVQGRYQPMHVADPSTHHCRCKFTQSCSNHAGHNLRRPQEFFQAFGSYALVMLKMVMQGISWAGIPRLDTFDILRNFDPNNTNNHITEDTIHRVTR